MAMEDPGLWKTLSGYLWAVVLIPLKILWDRVSNSISEKQLTEALMVRDKAIDSSKSGIIKLYENAENDRRINAERFATMQGKLHDQYVEILKQLSNRSQGH